MNAEHGRAIAWFAKTIRARIDKKKMELTVVIELNNRSNEELAEILEQAANRVRHYGHGDYEPSVPITSILCNTYGRLHDLSGNLCGYISYYDDKRPECLSMKWVRMFAKYRVDNE